MSLDLCARGHEVLLDRLVDLAPQPRERGALLLALDGEPVSVGGDAGLEIAEQLLLALLEVGDALPHPVRCAVEVMRPVRQPLLDLRLCLGQRLRQRVGGCTLLRGELRAAFLCDAPLFVGEQ